MWIGHRKEIRKLTALLILTVSKNAFHSTKFILLFLMLPVTNQ